MNVHFIAIGGSAMHNLAIALHKKGARVSGSDDEIVNPSRDRLKKYGLLPEANGWFPEKVHSGLDAVILGMHAREDNPELARARELGLRVFSYPEFLYEQSKEKTRVVVGGSHGKTTITAMILHALDRSGIRSDFMVGAQLEGFEVMVSLSGEAPWMVLEGDEYLSSPIDRRPKFHLYKPHIALLSGIAWDHINVFPSFESYLEQFRTFIQTIRPGGTLIWCQADPVLRALCEESLPDGIRPVPYSLPDYTLKKGLPVVRHEGREYPVQVFGKHNLYNLEGARLVCGQMGLPAADFLDAIGSFRGASNRLEKMHRNNDITLFRDFAHAPSKLKATIGAVREFFPEKRLVACMELHTFSSLNKDFLGQYRCSMDQADTALVFFSPHALHMKRLPELDPEAISGAFNRPDLQVYSNAKALHEALSGELRPGTVLLMMSSGDFAGLDFKALTDRIDQQAKPGS